MRPINLLAERAQTIAAVHYVDCIDSFNEETSIDIICAGIAKCPN
jgi:bifunctional ADP-heptose synthase (sugar kinase/adenylyltransferase)